MPDHLNVDTVKFLCDHKFLIHLTLTLLLSLMPFGVAAATAELCRPFRVHMKAERPQLSHSEVDTSAALKELTTLSRRDDFPQLFATFLRRRGLTKMEQSGLLGCWLAYMRQDSDADGVADWTAVIDGRLSSTLYPLDEDMDGDGVANVLDPQPLNIDIAGQSKRAKALPSIPAHLLSTAQANREMQAKLFQKTGIIAIDHSDQHSPVVLRSFLTLLERTHSKKLISTLDLKYLYAFRGHDDRHNIAGYHLQAKALSIGGRLTYKPNDKSLGTARKVTASLAHELGHAFMLAHMNLGGWGSLLSAESPLNLFASVFFLPLRAQAATPENGCPATPYGRSNVHEWFADCYMAFTLSRLDKAVPSQGFNGWLRDRIREIE